MTGHEGRGAVRPGACGGGSCGPQAGGEVGRAEARLPRRRRVRAAEDGEGDDPSPGRAARVAVGAPRSGWRAPVVLNLHGSGQTVLTARVAHSPACPTTDASQND